MSKRTPQTKAQARRTTSLVAIATFVGLSILTLAGWAITRPDAPRTDPPSEQAAMVSQQQPQAEPEHKHVTGEFQTISATDLKALYDKGEVMVLDVRSMEQYAASHIKDAGQIPLTRIEGEIPYLPKDKLIVTYCTCPAEETSGEAALILANGGIKAMALKGGLDAWTAAGYPIAAGLK